MCWDLNGHFCQIVVILYSLPDTSPGQIDAMTGREKEEKKQLRYALFFVLLVYTIVADVGGDDDESNFNTMPFIRTAATCNEPLFIVSCIQVALHTCGRFIYTIYKFNWIPNWVVEACQHTLHVMTINMVWKYQVIDSLKWDLMVIDEWEGGGGESPKLCQSGNLKFLLHWNQKSSGLSTNNAVNKSFNQIKFLVSRRRRAIEWDDNWTKLSAREFQLPVFFIKIKWKKLQKKNVSVLIMMTGKTKKFYRPLGE